MEKLMQFIVDNNLETPFLLSLGVLCVMSGLVYIFVIDVPLYVKAWRYCQDEILVRNYNLLLEDTHEEYPDFKQRIKTHLVKGLGLHESVAQGCIDNILNKDWFYLHVQKAGKPLTT